MDCVNLSKHQSFVIQKFSVNILQHQKNKGLVLTLKEVTLMFINHGSLDKNIKRFRLENLEYLKIDV